jgi:tetratricopeptide (TPR) repeat protein
MFKIFIVLFLSLGMLGTGNLIASAADSNSSWAEWESVKTLYDSLKYREALEALQSKPSEKANYFYNLGTIYYKLVDMGPAVAHLEKANRLQPHDPSIQANLALSRLALIQTIGSDKLDPASSSFEQWGEEAPTEETQSILYFLVVISLLAWLSAYLKFRSLPKMLTSLLGNIGLVGFLLAATLYFANHWANRNPVAVLLQRQTIRSGPGDHYSSLSQLDAGVKVRILPNSTENSTDMTLTSSSNPAHQTESWQQVRYSSEGIGWVKISNLLVL